MSFEARDGFQWRKLDPYQLDEVPVQPAVIRLPDFVQSGTPHQFGSRFAHECLLVRRDRLFAAPRVQWLFTRDNLVKPVTQIASLLDC